MDLKLKGLNQIKRRASQAWRAKRWILISGSFLTGCLVLIYLVVPSLKPSQPVPPAVSPNESIPGSNEFVCIPAEPQLQTIEGQVGKNGNLFKSLTDKKIPLEWVDLVITQLKPHLNFKKIKGGTFRFITDLKGELVRFVFEAGPTEVYEVEKDTHGYVAQRKHVPLETYLVKVVGEVRSSFFEAMDAAGEQDQLTIALAEILACEIDFYKDIKRGDRFKAVVEKVYKGEQFIRYGAIHAVEYQGENKISRGFHYKGDYYTEKGTSLRKAFLKAPLRFTRISSRFSRARNHPILGGLRPHFGVDYAAPSGTPVWAVAEGAVLSCGWGAGFGKQVILRHPNGYMTCYGHLSRYSPGIRKGSRVKQKQVIGYVGSTGLSTGPHLDYRLLRDAEYRNPLKESFPAGGPIGRGEAESFQSIRENMMRWLQGDTCYKTVVGEIVTGTDHDREKEDPHRR